MAFDGLRAHVQFFMLTTFRYKQVLTAREYNPREICSVGAFENRLPRVDGLSFPLTDEDLVLKSKVPNSACFGHLGRAGCLSLLHFESLKDAVRGLDLSRIGIYSSISLGPVDTESIAALSERGYSTLGSTLRRMLPPKQIFKYVGNTSAVQLGIFLGITGPLYSFQDWNAGLSSALDQALMDLEFNSVDAAIVVASYALDDCLQNFYFSNQSKKLCEATACALLVKGDPSSPGTELGATTLRDEPEHDLYFGTAEALVRLWSQHV